MPKLTWLHLSDLHRGAKGETRDWPVVRDALGRDLRDMAERIGPPDLVLFTGDLAFSGSEDQYQQVEEQLDWLDHSLGRPLPVFAVPGNHDLARPKDKRVWTWLYSEDEPARRLREDALTEDPADLAALFSQWQAFAERRLLPRLPRAEPGLLPGDLRWSIEVDGLKLGLLGLNSAWRQHDGGDFQGRVEVSPHQVHTLLPKGADAFRDQHHLVLLLQHHPPDWMADPDRWHSHVGSAAHVALVGHMHDNRAEVHRAESNEDRALAMARSLCGLEHYGRDDEERRFGYRWGQAEVQNAGVDGLVTRVRTWSRTLVESDRWQFVHPEASGYREPEGMKLTDVPVPSALLPRHRRRVQPPQPLPTPRGATVAVVAVRTELGSIQDAVATRLGRLTGLERVDVVDAADSAGSADLTLVLVGGRTGGADHLATAVARPDAVALRCKRLDPDHLEPAELGQALALQARATLAFDTADEAAEHALSAVADWLRARAPGQPGAAPVLDELERDMLTQRLPLWTHGRHSGLVAAAGSEKLHRAALYVPLRAERDLVFAQEDGTVVVRADPIEADHRRDPQPGMTRERQPVLVERALCQPELSVCVVRGQPGGGKTVLLQHLAMVLANAHLARPLPEHGLDLDLLTGQRPLRPVPVLIEASALARHLAVADGVRGLGLAICEELAAATGTRPEADQTCAGLRAGRFLVLIDALDEVPGRAGRQRVVQCLAGLADQADWHSRVVLTTRPAAYTAVSLKDLPVVHIADLDQHTAGELIGRWCDTQGHGEDYRRELAAALFEAGDRYRGAQFVTNPMLLTAAMLVYGRQQSLPHSTATLYKELVTVLCVVKKTRWPGGDQDTIDPDTKRQALEQVCDAMQSAGGTDLPVLRGAEALQQWRPSTVPDIEAGRTLLDRLANDTGLLRFEDRGKAGRTQRVLRPWHRSFQEFLAANHLGARETSVADVVDDLVTGGQATDPAWEGVLRFLVGVHGGRSKARARAWVERLHHHASAGRTDRPGRLWGLVAAALAEYRDDLDGLDLAADVPGQVVTAYEADGHSWPLADRLLALDALGQLGDPRLDGPLWVAVPGGSFTMGADRKAYQVAPVHPVSVPPFRIAWRPVTVQDYGAFVEDGGPEPGRWRQQGFHPNRPVVELSWADAVAYCAWATKTWDLPAGHQVRLPSEAEWEFVAAGPEGRVYPWGGEADEPERGDLAQANWGGATKETALSPVGAFPAGAVDFGGHKVVDLAGNVFEWCADAWREPEDADNWRQLGHLPFGPMSPAASVRVVRGGSWSDGAGDLRCSDRGRIRPQRRDGSVGFRVVCVPSREH